VQYKPVSFNRLLIFAFSMRQELNKAIDRAAQPSAGGPTTSVELFQRLGGAWRRRWRGRGTSSRMTTKPVPNAVSKDKAAEIADRPHGLSAMNCGASPVVNRRIFQASPSRT
jgi:hypothetical protein